MTCEQVLEQLPDYVLGTLPETEAGAVRRHLRGCSACRSDAQTLDQGLVMFADAAHAAPPPPELKDRVMSVLAEEWVEAPATAAPRRGPPIVRWMAVAAAVLLLAGTVAWGTVSQMSAHRARAALGNYRIDAETYNRFLHALGGKDVRVATLTPHGTSVVTGTAVLYDSDKGQSWVLVLARAPGYAGQATVTLSSADGRTIRLFPIKFDERGDGSSWLVTSANISDFSTVRLSSPSGDALASGNALRRAGPSADA